MNNDQFIPVLTWEITVTVAVPVVAFLWMEFTSLRRDVRWERSSLAGDIERLKSDVHRIEMALIDAKAEAEKAKFEAQRTNIEAANLRRDIARISKPAD